jgi:predicted nuclease of predicted toxin-antitoxin system
MKILIDMNLSPRWVTVFVSHGIEAVHWSSVGAANATDSEIINYAHAHGYTIITHDLDFSAILTLNRQNKPSLIQLRHGDINPDNSGPLVINAIRQASSDIETGAILTIEINKARLRIFNFRT